MSKAAGAREEMLGRMRQALRDVPADEPRETRALARRYHSQGTTERATLVERFVERMADYKVVVRRVEARERSQAIAAICGEHGIQRLVVPADLPPDWLPGTIEQLRDDPPLSNEQLDRSDGVLTGCALGIAQTGTIVLDGGTAQGRRVLTLLPDYHLCILYEKQIVDLVPEAILKLSEAVQHLHRPLTFISGPSATSDIELNRVEGVHGPRTFEVLVIKDDETGTGKI